MTDYQEIGLKWMHTFQGVHFEFGAVTVDPQTPAYDPSPLKQYLKVLGVPYFYESQCELDFISRHTPRELSGTMQVATYVADICCHKCS